MTDPAAEDYSDLMELIDDDSQGDEEEIDSSQGMFDETEEGEEPGSSGEEAEHSDDADDSGEGEDTSDPGEDSAEESRAASGEGNPDPETEGYGEDYRKRTQNLESLTERLAAIQEQNEQRRQKEDQERRQKAEEEARQRAEAERNKPLWNEDELNLTDEERTAYKDALPVLKKVARSVAQDVHNRSVRPLQEEVQRLQGQTESIDRSTNQTRAEAFVSAIRGAVPDLDQRTKAKGWEDYMREQVSVPGQGRMSRAQAVQLATRSSDLSYVVDQVQGFKMQGSSEEKPSGARSPGNGQSSAATAKKPKSTSRVVSYAKSMAQLEEMSQKVRAGRMSLDKYETAVDKFEAEMAAGNVRMDA